MPTIVAPLIPDTVTGEEDDVVAGARDSFVPLETMRELAFTAPHVRWKVLAQATHALPAEFPERVSAELLDLVREVAGRKALASAT